MKIIPVIDVMKGIVVHARGGKRKQYQALTSILTSHTNPQHVIADILRFYPFQTLYMADIDAISGRPLNLAFYKQLAERFPHVTFWLDAGIKTCRQWQQLRDHSGMTPVIASESLSELTLLNKIKPALLSLDFQYGVFLGKANILRQAIKWPDNVIVMNLDAVGENLGPNIHLLKEINAKRTDINIMAAGGVRNKFDLLTLQKNGIKASLVATALHNGEIDRATIKALSLTADMTYQT